LDKFAIFARPLWAGNPGDDAEDLQWRFGAWAEAKRDADAVFKNHVIDNTHTNVRISDISLCLPTGRR
jgi:hypothetical protein